MYRFRVPEIFLGCFLTVAVLATGILFQPFRSAQTVEKQETARQRHKAESPDAELTGSTWLTKDAAGFFTFWLVVVGFGQAILFFIQLRYMRKGMDDATRAARAAEDAAKAGMDQAKVAERALTELERPWVFVFGPKYATTDGEEFFVEYTVANYGKMPAIIEGASLGFVFDAADGGPQLPLNLDEDHSLVSSPILSAGEERPLREYFPANPRGEVSFRMIHEGTDEQSLIRTPSVEIGLGHRLFFRVIIPYRGPISRGHETRANWLYREEPMDFVRRGGQLNNHTK